MRRSFLSVLAAATVTLAAGPAAAEYPDRPVTIIVPFGAGDAVDGTARVMASGLEDALGGSVVVRNVPGGGGAAGTAAAKAEGADGHTLLMGSTGALTARPLISDVGYATADFAPIAQLVEVPIAVAVREDSPLQTMDDLVTAAQAEDLRYATPAPASTQHIEMERFAAERGLGLVHVGGQGGAGAVTKALSGEVDFVFVGAPNYTALADGGELRVLAVAAPERAPYLPEVPTMAEAGYPMDAAVWFGLLANAEAPGEAIEALRAATAEVAQGEDTLALYERYDFTPAYLDAEAFGARIAETVERNDETLREAGLLE